MIENIGLIHEEHRETDHVLGAENLAGDVFDIIKPVDNGMVSWAEDEPTFEVQRKAIETNGCVSFSGNNMYEYLSYLLMKKDGAFKNFLSLLGLLDENGKPNFSDRRTAKGSGTDPNRGNSVRAVSDYLRNFLFCPEDLWSFPFNMTRDEYYAVMPDEVANFHKKMKDLVAVNDKYVNIAWNDPEYGDKMLEALQYSPIWVSVKVPYVYQDGFIKADDEMKSMLRSDQRPYGHRILARTSLRGKYVEAHDQYNQQIIKFDYNYPFGDPKIGRVSFLGDDMEDVLQVGKDLYMRAKGGKFKDEYFIFEDGDVAKAISPDGDYTGLKPRTKLGNPPAQFKGNVLGLKKKLTLSNLFNLFGI